MTEQDTAAGFSGRAEERARAAGAAAEELVRAMATIAERCVWTQGIGHRELVPYLIEETAELAEAIEVGDRDELIEELGDVLWQVVFHAEIGANEAQPPFALAEVMTGVLHKMVRRHPHVFGGESAPTVADVERVWAEAKAVEKSARTSALDGIPAGMPALALAAKVLARARPLGVGALASERLVDADTDARPSPEAPEAPEAREDALGERLLAVVAEAAADGLDAERALRGAVRRLGGRVRAAERGESPS